MHQFGVLFEISIAVSMAFFQRLASTSQEIAMSTRREFIQSIPAASAAFAVAGNLILEANPARAQEAAAGHCGHGWTGSLPRLAASDRCCRKRLEKIAER